MVVEGPAHQGEVVDHNIGQETLGTIVEESGGAVAFAQLGPVGAEDDGQMTVFGGSHAKGLVEEQVPGSAGKPLLGSQHMGYFHQVVIDHVGHVVGRKPVCLDEHEIAEFVRLERRLRRVRGR